MGTMQFFLWRSNNERILENIENYLSISDDPFKWHFTEKITSILKWSSQLISLDNNGHQRIVHIRFELVQRNVEAQEQNYSCILLYLSYFWWAVDLNLSLQMHVITTFDRMIPFFCTKNSFFQHFFFYFIFILWKRNTQKLLTMTENECFPRFFFLQKFRRSKALSRKDTAMRALCSSLMLSWAILSSTFIISGFIRVEIER